MVMSIVLVTIAVFLLTKIVPFSRTVRGMQDSLQARYEAISWAEKGLLMFYFQRNTTSQNGKKLLNNPYSNINYYSDANPNSDRPSPTASPFYVKSLTREIPLQYESEYFWQVWANNEWNKIVPWQSIFLNVTWAEKLQLKNTTFTFSTPGGWQTPGTPDDQLFLITLSGIEPRFQQNLILTVLPNPILGWGQGSGSFSLNDLQFVWVTNRGEQMTPSAFFDSLVFCDNFCSIEFSLIGDIGNHDHIEYKIDTQTLVPDIHALLVSRWEAAGYGHTFYGDVPQQGFISGISFATQ